MVVVGDGNLVIGKGKNLESAKKHRLLDRDEELTDMVADVVEQISKQDFGG